MVDSRTLLTCRSCRVLLPAYIERELPLEMRSQVAAHIDRCDCCHASYVHQRALASGLRADLPALGRLDAARASVLWIAVQSDLAATRRSAPFFGQGQMSLAVLLMAAALLLPWLASTGRLSALPLPLPPTPVSAGALATDAPIESLASAQIAAFQVTPPGAPEYAPTQAPATLVLSANR